MEKKDPRTLAAPSKKDRRAVLRRLRTGALYVLAVLAMTAVLLVIYELAIHARWQPMYWIYYALLFALAIGYVFYNRGFTRTRVSRESLPGTWTEAEKDAFYADAHRRLRRSRPVLLLVCALALVFVYDAVALYFGDFLEYVFPFMEWAR